MNHALSLQDQLEGRIISWLLVRAIGIISVVQAIREAIRKRLSFGLKSWMVGKVINWDNRYTIRINRLSISILKHGDLINKDEANKMLPIIMKLRESFDNKLRAFSDVRYFGNAELRMLNKRTGRNLYRAEICLRNKVYDTLLVDDGISWEVKEYSRLRSNEHLLDAVS